MNKEIIINAVLAAAWVFLGQLEAVEGVAWIPIAVLLGRAALGWAAVKLGKPIPVDE